MNVRKSSILLFLGAFFLNSSLSFGGSKTMNCKVMYYTSKVDRAGVEGPTKTVPLDADVMAFDLEDADLLYQVWLPNTKGDSLRFRIIKKITGEISEYHGNVNWESTQSLAVPIPEVTMKGQKVNQAQINCTMR
jgi:hypothetical protein